MVEVRASSFPGATATASGTRATTSSPSSAFSLALRPSADTLSVPSRHFQLLLRPLGSAMDRWLEQMTLTLQLRFQRCDAPLLVGINCERHRIGAHVGVEGLLLQKAGVAATLGLRLGVAAATVGAAAPWARQPLPP